MHGFFEFQLKWRGPESMILKQSLEQDLYGKVVSFLNASIYLQTCHCQNRGAHRDAQGSKLKLIR